VETLTALVTVTQPEDAERYRRAFTALCEAASFGAEALAMLERIAADVRRAGGDG
jgi:hypothetical protein